MPDSQAPLGSREIQDPLKAEAWTYSPELERAIELRDAGQPIDAGLRLALGYYESGKRAAERQGRDTGAPPKEAPQWFEE